MKILLDKNKKYFKANMHCHSSNSDGKLSVGELKEEYKKRGYSVIAFTDHEHLIDNSYLDDKDFLTITSCEIAIKEFENQSTLKNYDMRVCHLNLYAKDQHNTLTPCYSSVYDHYINDNIKDLINSDTEFKRIYSSEGINEIIKSANERGFLVSYNHPSWSLEGKDDYINYENLFSVEIYNHSCVMLGIPDDEKVFDDLLRDGKKIFCIAGDDNHNRFKIGSESCDSFGGWININADNLEYSEIIKALENGKFYASTGPLIYSLIQDNDKIIIESSPAKKITLTTGGRRCDAVYSKKDSCITKAEFILNSTDKYVRLKVEDEKGKKAYTQAYYIN